MDVTYMFLSISPTINKAKNYGNANKQIKAISAQYWYVVDLIFGNTGKSHLYVW